MPLSVETLSRLGSLSARQRLRRSSGRKRFTVIDGAGAQTNGTNEERLSLSASALRLDAVDRAIAALLDEVRGSEERTGGDGDGKGRLFRNGPGEQVLAAAHERLVAVMEHAGVAQPWPLLIDSDGKGRFEVLGPAEQRTALHHALANDAGLNRVLLAADGELRTRAIASLVAAMLDAATANPEMSELYFQQAMTIGDQALDLPLRIRTQANGLDASFVDAAERSQRQGK